MSCGKILYIVEIFVLSLLLYFISFVRNIEYKLYKAISASFCLVVAFFIKFKSHDIPKYLLLILPSLQSEYLLNLLSTDSPTRFTIYRNTHEPFKGSPAIHGYNTVPVRTGSLYSNGSPSRQYAITGRESLIQHSN